MKKLLLLLVVFFAMAGVLLADNGPATAAASVSATAAVAPALKVDSGDTAWVLISSALVLLMTAPGLALFYGGLVRRKNMLSVLMQCMIMLGLVSVQWVIYGYSLAFHPGNGFWGGFGWSFLKDVGFTPNADYAPTIPHQAFMIFQAMFAVITPALIIGAFAERMKFSAFLIFSLVWATFVYDPVAHWVWGTGGWLKNLGTLDFAGGTVVHINAGIAALASAIVIGRRKYYDNKPTPPHNMVFSVTGAGLLWFGWFGFNAGSALQANGLATSAFVVTNTATAMAALTWALLDKIVNGKSTVLGTISGAVAGLVAITPASGFVDIKGALAIGILVSIICFCAVSFLKPKLGYDDALDAFGVHCVGGITGALLTGLFATIAINPAGANGLFYGNPKQFITQLIAVGITLAYSFICTIIILKLIDMTIGLRASEKEEVIGLDLTQHHESAYTLIE